MKAFLRKLLGQHTWKKEWQEALSLSLREAQQGLNLNMVVAVAAESDFYAELLYILSFIGICLGTLLSFFLRDQISSPSDFLLIPLLGFAIGSSLFQFRHLFLSRVAPRATRERVAARAKSLFFDHSQNLKGRVVLLYFSEMEHEVLLVASPGLLETVPENEMQKPLSKLIREYSRKDPLKSVQPCLEELGKLLRMHLVSSPDESQIPREFLGPIYIGSSDKRDFLKVPILKGSKDIN